MNKLARQLISELYYPLPKNVRFLEGRIDGCCFKPTVEWPVETVTTAADEVALVEQVRMGEKTVSRVGEDWYGTYVVRGSGDILIVRSTDKEAVCRWIGNVH